MSISSISNTITRLTKELSDIDLKISVETKKETSLQGRIVQINNSISKNTSLSSMKTKDSEIQRKRDDIAKIQVKKANLNKLKADRTQKVLKANQDLAKEEGRERKKIALEADKERRKNDNLEKSRQRGQIEFQRQMQNELEKTAKLASSLEQKVNSDYEVEDVEYDLFISHASEDKDEFVRPLAEALDQLGLNVWYDEFTLTVGDSLRKRIDSGLGNSKYGVVILSASFFAKNWTQYELDGMVAREMEGNKVILPIWHKVSKDEVIKFSPTLADKLALNSITHSIEEIAEQLSNVISS